KDTRALVEHSVTMVQDLQEGKDVEVNDPDSYDNGTKVVPAYLLTPQSVPQETVTDAYANDPVLGPLTK
ncbi:MAG: sugar ABC transporter substrate-binding protein, partial [Micrococcaceae bacterium]|nr:sugar ABC transporter substrate-binding protein [Micrococcaceae bacterium]